MTSMALGARHGALLSARSDPEDSRTFPFLPQMRTLEAHRAGVRPSLNG